MSITIRIPRVSGLPGFLLTVGEPCLVALAAAAGLGPVGQALLCAALRLTRYEPAR